MEVIKTNPMAWKQEAGVMTFDGRTISKDITSELLEYSGIPETLANIDAKHETNFTLQLLQKTAKKDVEFVIDNDKILSVVDPRSKFITDEQFDEIVESFVKSGAGTPQYRKVGAATRAFFEVQEQPIDFVGDIFKKRLILERCKQGGLYVNVGLLRLACTNGQLVNDSSVRKLYRKGIRPTEAVVNPLLSLLMAFDTKQWLSSIFMDADGNFRQASVAQYLGMKTDLEQITEEGIADAFYPIEPIQECYQKQGFDLGQLSRKVLDRLPVGLTYYDCFSFLTNAIKQKEEHTLKDEIKIGRWCSHSNARNGIEDLVPEGIPVFKQTLIDALKGDAPVKL